MAVVAIAFQARADRRCAHQIDYLGAALLAGGLASIVLFTSLGGTTYAWSSTQMLALIVVGVVLLVGLRLGRGRAAEPILPLGLFRNRVFSVTSAVGFIVGLALFGAFTYLPLYLQTVKGHSPTESGLLLTPLMAGLLVTSIASGRIISRIGRYKPFPIVGTAIMAVGLALLSRLHGRHTDAGSQRAYMVVLGLGLGLVMQVLVLAVQNAVEYKYLGVATSGSTFFRQIGGSIGVAVFGAIFANQLAANLATSLPAGAHAPAVANPAAIRELPPDTRSAYITSVTDALHPVFLAAAGAAALAFLLTWLLHELPLRATTRAPDIGEGFNGARDDDALRELERALSLLAGREQRWQLYQRLATRAGIELPPPELWLLARLGEREPLTGPQLADELHVDVRRSATRSTSCRSRSLVASRDDGAMVLTALGREDYERLVAAKSTRLRELLAGWQPDELPELQRMVDRLGRDLVSAIPSPPAASGAGG